jgi:hypothetical protein
MAVLDSVRQSVLQAKEVQKKKIGENVDLVVQALKKIESDIRSRFDDVGNSIEKRVASIQDGRDGADGKDGRDGKDGKNGRDGAKGDRGERGQDGVDGVDGNDGVSVSNARIDFDGSLIITLSSGVELNVGEVVAPDLAERIKVITNGGGTSQSVLDTLASLQTQITNLIPSQTGNSGKFLTTNGTALSWSSVAGGLSYQGTWNANTNTPTLTSSVGVNGYYYIVATAGSTNLNGITDWQIGDWLMFNGSVWQKIDQSNLVTSVAGRTGAVTLSNTDISGLGTMSTQNASSVAITGGTATLTSLTTPTVQATNSAGLSLKNSAGTTQLSMGAGGGDNLSLNVSTNINGTNAQIDISPTGTGHVHIKPTGSGSIEVAPTNVGTINNMTIGATTPKNGSFVDLSVTGTTSFDGSQGTAGQVLTSAGTGATPTWTTPTTGTVTSVTGTSPIASSGGTTPDISLAASYGDTQNPYASKTANFVLAAPNGSAGVPTFRAVVAADIPTLNQNTTGTASNVTGTVAIVNGGSGQTTAQLAINAFAGAVTSGSYLRGNGTNVVMNTIQAADVPTLNQNTTGTASNVTGTVAVANGGTGLTTIPHTVQVFTSGSGTYTSPAGVKAIRVTLVGGGGGGGGINGSGAAGGGGGGGTALWLYPSGFAAATGYAYAVGASGAGGVNTSASTGSTGGSTTFTIGATTVTAGGGAGGAASLGGTAAGGTGGTSTNGTVNMVGGGGGESYGPSLIGGTGGSSTMGGGGRQAFGTATVGGNYGGGGAGAVNNAALAGGAGAGGLIIVEEFYV